LDEFGLDPADIHDALSDLFERFHWADMPPASEATREA
jgi:hypothetical protein